MNVYQKLNEARAKFHSLKLEKTGHNKFAGYKYFELGDFLIPALGVFREVGLCAIVSFDKDTATMHIMDVDAKAPDDMAAIRITSPMGSAALKGCHEVQNVGAVETYQRRYLWTAAMEIVEHDALDATTGKDKPVAKKTMPDASVISAPAIAFAQQHEEVQAQLRQRAQGIVSAMPNVKLAVELIEVVVDEWPDNDQIKPALWYLLDSKTRSAIKAHKQPETT